MADLLLRRTLRHHRTFQQFPLLVTRCVLREIHTGTETYPQCRRSGGFESEGTAGLPSLQLHHSAKTSLEDLGEGTNKMNECSRVNPRRQHIAFTFRQATGVRNEHQRLVQTDSMRCCNPTRDQSEIQDPSPPHASPAALLAPLHVIQSANMTS